MIFYIKQYLIPITLHYETVQTAKITGIARLIEKITSLHEIETVI